MRQKRESTFNVNLQKKKDKIIYDIKFYALKL